MTTARNQHHLWNGNDDTNTLDCSANTSNSSLSGYDSFSHTTGSKTTFIAPNQKRRRGFENLESLTINKLRFHSLGLYGRESEIRTLKHCMERIIRPSITNKANDNAKTMERKETEASPASFHRELVMIKGYSGTGKSALACTLRNPVKKLGGLYVEGKFDLFLRDDQPFAGVLSACNQICRAILDMQRSSPDDFQAVRSHLASQLRAELGVILRFLPALKEVLPSDVVEVVANQDVETPNGQSGEEGKNQFNFAFRCFIRVIGSLFKPLVMVSCC